MVLVIDIVKVGVLVVVVRARGGGRDVEPLRGLGALEVVGGLAVDAEAFEPELSLRHGSVNSHCTVQRRRPTTK